MGGQLIQQELRGTAGCRARHLQKSDRDVMVCAYTSGHSAAQHQLTAAANASWQQQQHMSVSCKNSLAHVGTSTYSVQHVRRPNTSARLLHPCMPGPAHIRLRLQ